MNCTLMGDFRAMANRPIYLVEQANTAILETIIKQEKFQQKAMAKGISIHAKSTFKILSSLSSQRRNNIASKG